MIVCNERDGDIIIPLKGFEQSRYVDLPPGYYEVSDQDWALARSYVLDKIDAGIIKEEWRKVDKSELDKNKDKPVSEQPYPVYIASDDLRESSKVQVPARFSDLDHKGQRVDNVIKQTFSLPTLQSWVMLEDRPEVKAAIQKQIEGIEKAEIKG